jgi:CrcB protein
LALIACHRVFRGSSFSAEVVAMLSQGSLVLALATSGLHLIGSLLMTLAGLKTVALLLE